MAEGKHKPKQTGLVLIGMGPGMLVSMTTEAIIAAKSADYRYYEAYKAKKAPKVIKNATSNKVKSYIKNIFTKKIRFRRTCNNTQ